MIFVIRQLSSPGFSAGHASYISLAIDSGGTPYVAFRDEANSDKVTVMKFDGTKFDSDVELTFPYSFILGFGYIPNYNLMFSAFFNYRLYGDMDEITFKTVGVKVRNKTYYEHKDLNKKEHYPRSAPCASLLNDMRYLDDTSNSDPQRIYNV